MNTECPPYLRKPDPEHLLDDLPSNCLGCRRLIKVKGKDHCVTYGKWLHTNCLVRLLDDAEKRRVIRDGTKIVCENPGSPNIVRG